MKETTYSYCEIKSLMNITSNTVREKLLTKAELKLAETIDICSSSELTRQLMAGMSQHEQLHAVNGTSNSHSRDTGNDSWQRSKNPTENDHDSKAQACKLCGTKQAVRNCPVYGRSCNKCGMRNHLARCCSNFDKVKQTQKRSVNYKICFWLGPYSEHMHLLYHSEVRWLSRGNVLQRVHCANRLTSSCWRRIIPWPHDSQIPCGCCKATKNLTLVVFSEYDIKVGYSGHASINC